MLGKKFLCFMMLACLAMPFFISADEVFAGYESGDYYVADFQEYAHNTDYLNESISGVTWLYANTSTHSQSGVNAVDEPANPKWQLMGGGTGLSWFRLYQDTTEIKYRVDTGSSVNERWRCTHWLYNKADKIIGGVQYSDYYNGGNVCDFRVLNGTSVFFDIPDDYGGFSHVNTSFINHNTSVHVEFYDDSTNELHNIWYQPDNYDYVKEIKFVNEDLQDNTYYQYIDNFKISSVEGGIIWDIEKTSYGTVTQLEANYVSFSFISDNDYVIETENRNLGLNFNLNQVALAVTEDSDIDEFTFYLRIGNTVAGEYTSRYYWVDRYVYVWENLNINWDENNVNIEFKLIGTVGAYNCEVMTSFTDIDGDGDTQVKYSGDDNYYNGAYDGAVTDNSIDWLYQVWYEGSDPEGTEYGDVSNYTASNNIYNQDHTIVQTDCPAKYFEWKSNYYVSQTVYGFDMLVTDQYFEDLPDSYHQYIQAYFTTYYAGAYDYAIPMTDKVYILRWIFDTPVVLENEIPFIQLRLSCGIGYTQFIVADYDFNSDGENFYYKHSIGQMFGNSQPDGTKVNGFEPIWRYWYIASAFDEDEYDTDFITVGDNTVFAQYDTITFSAVTTNPFVQNTVHAYHYDGASWNEYATSTQYPYADMPKEYILESTFSGGFTAPLSGQWNVTLEYNDQVRASAWFNVTSEEKDYIIITKPYPSKPREEVQIYANYNLSDSLEVQVAVYDTDGYTVLDEFPLTEKQTLVNVGSHIFNEEGVYYIKIERRYNNTFEYGSMFSSTHVCKDRVYDDWVGVEQDLIVGLPNNAVQTIYYTHNHLGSNAVAILLNEGSAGIYYVGTESVGEVYHTLVKHGTYDVALVLLEPDGNHLYLYNTSFVFNEQTGIVEESAGLDDIILIIFPDPVLRNIVGVMLIVAITFIPFIISLKLKQQHVTLNIPNVVYVVAFVAGVVIASVLGFLGWELMFFMALIIFLAVVGMYFTGKKSVSGEA